MGLRNPEVGGSGRLNATAVRVFSTSGEVVGAGFVVGPGLVATCAHVIADALGVDPEGGQAPAAPVRIDVPLLRPGALLTARVRRWAPIDASGGGDIAVLDVDIPDGDSVAAPPFWRADEPWGREFRMLGFPVEHDDGVWVSGEFRAPQGSGWLQLQAATGGQPITAGFSGAAVWDSSSAAVVGMAVASDRRRYTRTAFMIPIAEVLGADPTLLPNPYRGLERFDERDAHLFFGRDADTDRVLAAVDQRAVVAVAGRSGTGKSSLVSAGVIPRLRERGMSVAAFRLAGDSSAHGTEPTSADPSADSAAVVAALAQQVARQADSSPESATELASLVPAQGLVVFPDQFEDLAATAPDRARALLGWLVEFARAAEDAGTRVRVVLTLRWEALNELVDDELARLLDGATVALAPMGRTQLREVIRGPAERAPGVDVAADLVERLVEDTVSEPGGLPLLESMLTELWEQRGGGRLTLADYERAGRAGGSITRRAERALAQFTDSGSAAEAWRLLLMLAAPTTSGGFVRAVASLSDFPELRDIAGRLARDRLVVVGRRSDGAETAELAHQALVDNWPLLRERLERDRDFRSWQRQLEEERLGWEAAHRDSGALLRGSALSTAEEWLAARATDIPQADRRYLYASRKLRRREVRRLRAGIAVVAVLALVAASTAVVAYRSSRDRAEQLRLSAGISLAQESLRISESDPLKALQYAQAAQRNAPGRPEVEAALVREQIAWAGVASLDPVPWAAPELLSTDREGTLFLIVGKDGSATVWTGVLTGDPQPWVLPIPPSTTFTAGAVSADGSRVALFTRSGEVMMWLPRERRGPIAIRAADGATSSVSTLGRFSDDGTQLVVTYDPDRAENPRVNRPDRIEVYDTSSTRPALVAAYSSQDPTDRLPRRVDRTTVWFREQSVDAEPANVVRDIATGAVVRRLPSGRGRAGDAIIGCATTPTSDIVVSDPESGDERIRLRVPSAICQSAFIDQSERYAIMTDLDVGDAFGLSYVVDLRSGELFKFQQLPIMSKDGFFVRPTPEGVEVDVAYPIGLMRYKPATRVDDLNQFRDPPPVDFVWAPGGNATLAIYRVAADRRRVDALRLWPSQTRMSSAVTGSGPGELDLGSGDIAFGFTGDGRYLFAVGQTDELRVYAAEDLRLVRTMALPVPAALGRDVPKNGKDIKVLGDEVVVLYAGVLTRWRVDDGAPVGNPIPVFENTDELRMLAEIGKAVPRSDRTGQVVVTSPEGLAVWDLHDGRKLRAWNRDTLSTMPSLLLPAGKPEIYVGGRIWNMDTGAMSTPSHPIPTMSTVRGATEDGLIVAVKSDSVELWDAGRGRMFEFHPPGPGLEVGVRADSMVLMSQDGAATIDLSRENAFARLCAISDRDFTAAERDGLPIGADSTEPCRD
ncbi:type II secretory pathway pseudopilin PulG [Nocardia transvalensis]|uniref:Type II secretory pathway pseudopilin PulG n=1 Tax=Nocardia transvalensis TaxID=37333 RepID=A0A7W9PHU0_9NOCA|nr:serine protease [Nocardia transvalensis]MBB5915973.1 type II secretory pathway pseudopilin PulG [Nocardia transvalensis]